MSKVSARRRGGPLHDATRAMNRRVPEPVHADELRKRIHSPFGVALVVLVMYGSWLVFCFHEGHPPGDFLYLGSQFTGSSFSSPAISESDAARNVFTNVGYDGQFAYYIAVDPVNARYYMENDEGGGPGYRYGRILYPMAARLLALGQPNVIPYTMLLINWLSLGLGTLVLAAWLGRKGVSPWWALIFGFFPGLFTSLHKDLNEPMADALVALAVYLFSFGGKNRVVWTAVCFALAILTRETSVIFAVLYGLAVTFDHGTFRLNWRRALLFFIIALGPFELYQMFLHSWLHTSTTASQKATGVLSYQGIFAWWPWQGEQLDLVIAVVLPGLLCAGMGVWALTKRIWTVEVWVLLANVFVFIVVLNPIEFVNYLALGRIQGVVVLAALCCIPVFEPIVGRNRTWLWLASLLWLLPWYQLVPLALGNQWLGTW